MHNEPVDRSYARVEETLQRVVGAPELSSMQRREHRQRMMPSATTTQERRSWWRSGFKRPAYLVGVAVLVNLIVIASVLAYQRLTDGSAEMPVVEAGQRLLEKPAAGQGRHIIVDIQSRYSQHGGDKAWTMEVWERTLTDGTVESSVQAYNPSGERIGQYVQTQDGWFLEYQGSTQEGSGQIDWLPEELNPRKTGTVEGVQSTLMAYDPEQIEVREQGSVQRIQVDLTSEPGSGELVRQIEGELDQGESVQRLIWEIELDTAGDRLLATRYYAVVAESGELVTINERQFETWSYMPASAMAGDRFEIPQRERASNLEFVPPDGRQLPNGLTLTSHYREDSERASGGPTWFSERAVFSNDEGLTIDLTILPGFSTLTTEYPPGTQIHTTESSAGTVEWAERDLSESEHWAGSANWSVQAQWADEQFHYSLSSQSQERLTEEDLVAFVEAVSDAQETQ